MMQILKNNKVISIIIAVLLVIGAFWIVNDLRSKDSYSVVYLSSGEIYVGKLSTFPKFTLSDGYVLAITKDATDPTKNNFQLNPISKMVWAPEKLVINSKNIIFYGPLDKTSKIAQALAEQGK